LRSSAAADGGRCDMNMDQYQAIVNVAILGRRGRRPLLWSENVARDPLSVLRSSAAADGGRCR